MVLPNKKTTNLFLNIDHPFNLSHRDLRATFTQISNEEIKSQWGSLEVKATNDGVFEAGSFQSIIFEFTAGSMGIDEDGSIRFSYRQVSDIGKFQFDFPDKDNYVTAKTDGNIKLHLEARNDNRRPLKKTLYIHIKDGSLRKNEKIIVILGDTSKGSRGFKQQTYCENPCPVRFSVDPFGAKDFREYPQDIGFLIIPGKLSRFVICAPSKAKSSDEIIIRVKGEDEWGNPLRNMEEIKTNLVSFYNNTKFALHNECWHKEGVWFFPIKLEKEGSYFFKIEHDETPSISNGIFVLNEKKGLEHYWGDLHGQTGEAVGSGTIEEYYKFAETYGFIDVTTPQHNDFQISDTVWEKIKTVTNKANKPGKFITFNGYEWSGNTTMGGDHNVIFNEEDPPIFRSTGWLVGNPLEETGNLDALYNNLKSRKAMTIPHIGGRPASLEQMDPTLEKLVELHSAWGTFEWVYEKCFEKNFKIGFVCNSDGHKTRPGASYPGSGEFGTLGGLTCILADKLDRNSLWNALMQRRCYGTTGQRIVLDGNVNHFPIGSEASMNHANFTLKGLGTAPIYKVDLMKRSEIIDTFYPAKNEEPDTLFIRFGGARVYGRARLVKWNITISVDENEIETVVLNNNFNPDMGIKENNNKSFKLDCVSTGNLLNLKIKLKNDLKGRIQFNSNVASFSIDIEDLNLNSRNFFSAPIDQKIEAFVVNEKQSPLEFYCNFEKEINHQSEEPYFFRVTQLDEAKAWTSPFYIKKE